MGAEHEMNEYTVSGNIVDVESEWIFPGTLTIADGKIVGVNLHKGRRLYDTFLLPGFVDAHVHVESSMLPPSEFARLAVRHGTVATVSDPHEIANVLGIAGVEYMIENASTVPFKFFFGAPSCVPATCFETAGAAISPTETAQLLARDDIWYLSEMMNFPGVLGGDPEIREKLAHARAAGKPIDGHAPGLRGEVARAYFDPTLGITTDHECVTLDEARDKIACGEHVHILIREGSAARNFEALLPLLRERSDRCFFCSDDKHPNELERGHINELVARAIAAGIDLFDVLRAACTNPVRHYGLPVGQLRPGDPADFIAVDNLTDFRVRRTYIKGQVVAEDGETRIPRRRASVVNRFHATPTQPADFVVAQDGACLRVIEALDGQIVTGSDRVRVSSFKGEIVADTARDLLKIAVVDRYIETPKAPSVAFIRGFGLKRGAIAGSVAHDSHNILGVGASDEEMSRAINAVIACGGGLAVAVPGEPVEVLRLPIAGLLSDEDGFTVARRYEALEARARSLGSSLASPFMTLSFMALLVIPSLKLSDHGLFDGDAFRLTSLFTAQG